MIVDGKKIAEEVLQVLAKERGHFGALTLGVVMTAGDTATDSFVKIKARIAQRLGVDISRIELGANADTAEAVYAVQELAKNTQGIIVQLPLPAGVNLSPVLAALPESHDVDALNPPPAGGHLVRPPVAEAIAEILSRTGVTVAGKSAIVLGAGRLVGVPAAQLLRDLGAHVTVITRNEGSLEDLEDAEIVVCGMGAPGTVAPEMLQEGVVLIDAGTSEAGGRLAGDALPQCAEVASVFTPVPGGVGPIAVAMIFKNLLVLARRYGGLARAQASQ